MWIIEIGTFEDSNAFFIFRTNAIHRPNQVLRGDFRIIFNIPTNDTVMGEQSHSALNSMANITDINQKQ